MGISFNPNNFTEGGGFCPEGEYLITDAIIRYWDNEGRMDKRVYAVITLQPGTGGAKFKPEGELVEQKYGIGDPKFYVPSKTGKDGDVAEEGGFLIAAPGDTGKTQPSKQSNYYPFILSAFEAGIQFDDDIRDLVGNVVYMHHIPQKERAGMPGSLNDEGGAEKKSDKPKTLPVIKKLIASKSEVKGGTAAKAPAKAADKKAPAASKKEEPADNGEANDELGAALMEVLGDGEIQRSKLRVALFKALKDNPSSKALLTAYGEDAVLSSTLESIGYTLDGDTIKQQ
jgi:hypothetical protein